MRRVDLCHLVDHDHVADQVEPSATELLGPRDPEETELAHLPNVVPGERRVGVVLRGDRRDFVAGELAHHLAGREMLFGEIECVVHKSGGFRFVGGAKHVEKLLAVALEFHRTYTSNLTQRVLVRRPAHGHFGERPIGEHDVRRHLLCFGNCTPEIAQTCQQRLVRTAQHRGIVGGVRTVGRRRSPAFANLASRCRPALRGRAALLDVDARAEAIVASAA